MVKRKRPNTPLGDGDSAPSSVGGSGVPSPVSISAADVAIEDLKEEKRPVFKDPDFQHSSKTSNKKRAWRSLKQIVAQERALQWGEDFVHCKRTNSWRKIVRSVHSRGDLRLSQQCL